MNQWIANFMQIKKWLVNHAASWRKWQKKCKKEKLKNKKTNEIPEQIGGEKKTENKALNKAYDSLNLNVINLYDACI